MPHEPAALPLGYTPVPAGHLVSVVTYLEMHARPPHRVVPPSATPRSLQRLGADDVAAYRALFRQVGAHWLWFSRLVMPDDALMAILADARVEAYAVHEGDTPIGLLELDFRAAGEAELAFFGVAADRVGSGIGRWLMEQALDRVWAQPIRRLHVHTCTLDHPDAVSFYVRSGFTPYARAIEVAPDPRLSGALPRDTAPQVPVIG